MLLQLITVLYVLIAVAIIALVLMQRGSGAQAGSGFGGGASATVFGASGASNFLSKSTKWLAVAFFAISLGMAVYASKSARQDGVDAKPDLGVMAQQQAPAPVAPAAAVPTAPAMPAPVPVVPAQAAPAQPAPAPTTN
jgi:preprotein translocase subunit SecG